MKTFFRFLAVFLALTLVGGYVYTQAGGNLVTELGLDRLHFDSGRDTKVEDLQAQVDELQQKLDKASAEIAAASEFRSVKKEPARDEEDLPPITIGLQVPGNVPPVSTWKQPAPVAEQRTTTLMPGSKSDVIFTPRETKPSPPARTAKKPTPHYDAPVYPRQTQRSEPARPVQPKQQVQRPAQAAKTPPQNNNDNNNNAAKKRALMMGSKSAMIISPDDVNPPAKHASSGTRAP